MLSEWRGGGLGPEYSLDWIDPLRSCLQAALRTNATILIAGRPCRLVVSMCVFVPLGSETNKCTRKGSGTPPRRTH